MPPLSSVSYPAKPRTYDVISSAFRQRKEIIVPDGVLFSCIHGGWNAFFFLKKILKADTSCVTLCCMIKKLNRTGDISEIDHEDYHFTVAI